MKFLVKVALWSHIAECKRLLRIVETQQWFRKAKRQKLIRVLICFGLYHTKIKRTYYER